MVTTKMQRARPPLLAATKMPLSPLRQQRANDLMTLTVATKMQRACSSHPLKTFPMSLSFLQNFKVRMS
jgi:hypothetical protein